MRNVRAVLAEAALVAVLGLLLALVANAVSPRGLRLTRNYFPGGTEPPKAAVVVATNVSQAPSTPAVPNPIEATNQRLQQRGLQPIGSNDVIAAFRNPQHEQGLIAFIDARDDAHYQAGHIPGAWQFNHYRAENYLPTVLPVCMTAFKTVVYCTGGTCEDSEFAAIMLRDSGVPPAGLFVYVGGIAEWKTNGLPVEIGSRRSGQLLNPKP